MEKELNLQKNMLLMMKKMNELRKLDTKKKTKKREHQLNKDNN